MKKRRAKKTRTPLPRTPRRVVEDGIAWLSLAEAADRLGVDVSRLYRMVNQKGTGGLTTRRLSPEGRPVRYVTQASIDQYRRRAVAWKRLHGRTHGQA